MSDAPRRKTRTGTLPGLDLKCVAHALLGTTLLTPVALFLHQEWFGGGFANTLSRSLPNHSPQPSPFGEALLVPIPLSFALSIFAITYVISLALRAHRQARAGHLGRRG